MDKETVEFVLSVISDYDESLIFLKDLTKEDYNSLAISRIREDDKTEIEAWRSVLIENYETLSSVTRRRQIAIKILKNLMSSK